MAASVFFTPCAAGLFTADTMPFWSGGTLYVPYTVFNARLNGIGVGLGLDTSYNRNNNTVTIFNLKQMLVFDLNNGTCRDEPPGVLTAESQIGGHIASIHLSVPPGTGGIGGHGRHTVSAAGFASTVVNRLGSRRRTVYLTLEGGDNTAVSIMENMKRAAEIFKQ
mgnify:CR=1 FL=1